MEFPKTECDHVDLTVDIRGERIKQKIGHVHTLGS